MLEIGRVTPDDILSQYPRWTFIYTFNNLYYCDGEEAHSDLIRSNDNLKAELLKSLGYDAMSPISMRILLAEKPVGIAGRTGQVPAFPQMAKYTICSFWDNPILNELAIPCVKALLNAKLINSNVLISMPKSDYLMTVEEFIAGKQPPNKNIESEKAKLAMHLLKGNEKKQALQYAGASPAPRNPSLNPGEKYWAVNSESFSFKKWLEMCGTSVVFDPKQKPKEDWNWEGAPGKLGGVSPKKGPIKKKK